MRDEAIDTLLVRLTQGEDAAIERVCRDYEPFLRSLVRRRLTPALRAKFDSLDIVQSVWADVLRSYRAEGWRFNDRGHLQAFLARVMFNHFFTQCRRHSVALEHERPLPVDESPALPAASQPRPSQVAQADELWGRILDVCSSTQREVLSLKREGFSPGEIATRTGLHEGSVRRILYDLARRMAVERTRPDRATKAAP